MSLDEIEQLFLTRASIGSLYPEVKLIYEQSGRETEARARTAFLIGIYYRRIDREVANQYYDEVQQIASKLILPKLLSGYFQFQAEVALRAGDLAGANRFNEKSLSLALESDFHYGQCEASYLSGRVAFRHGLLDEAVDHLSRALRIAEEHGLLKRQVEIVSSLAEFYLQAQQPSASERYARDALRITRELARESEIPKATLRLATIELELKHYGEVTKLVAEVRKKLPKENRSLWCMTHTLTGKVHEAKRRFGEAEIEFHAALSLAEYVKAERVRSNIHSCLAELYLKTKQPALALEEGLAALQDAEKADDMYTRKEALARIHTAYKELGDYKHAHEYLERSNALIAESDTKLLKSRLEYHALKNDLELEQAKSETNAKESEVLRIQLDHKERELTEKVRHLLKQAETLREFRKDLRALIRRSPAGDPATQEVRARLAAFPEEEINWQEFEQEFIQARPHFLSALSTRYPDLTQMQRRVAAMVQMDLKSSDIAQLFCITERAVEFHRLNLRKKLRLKAEETLPKFLNQV